ncbi:glucosamine-6-phosphate deaminase [Deinococcus sp.]|uniref:glucosamine-6-phosphate deaminase n=1 Tax=Deinococcus sp. TaxID=47478 RepID=UPI003CC55928
MVAGERVTGELATGEAVPSVTLHVSSTPEALALAAADFIAARVKEKPDLSLLAATGNTPMPTYAELARRVQAGEADFRRVTAVQLDEYLGLDDLSLDVGDPRSLWAWMARSFVEPLGIRRVVRLHAPLAFEAEVGELGGLDLAVLGLGPNGHLGFNEPPSPPDAPTRQVALSAKSLESNRAYWGELPVPGRAITAGMNVLLAARETLLLVSGAHKQDILRRTLEGPQTPELPASYLRRTRLTVLTDEAAAP